MDEQQNDQLVLSLLQDRLRLSGEQLSRATELFNSCWRVLQSSSKFTAAFAVEGGENVWRPCIVWLIKSIPALLGTQQEQQDRAKASPESQEPPAGLPLSELLSACNTNLVSFFKELPVVLNKVKPTLVELTGCPNDIEQQLRLREWQETLVSLQQISNKYKDLFWHMQRSSGSGSASKQPLLRAGWLAFLIIKSQLLPGFPDLVSCLELLVCVLNLFVGSATYTDAQVDALRSAFPTAIESTGKFSTLKALSQEAKVDYSKTKVLMPQIEARFCALLDEAQFSWLPQPLPESLPHPQADKLETCCKVHLEGLTSKPQQLSELVLSLDESYQKFYMQQGEIDERDFLQNDFGALASPRALPGAAMPAAADLAAAGLQPSTLAAAGGATAPTAAAPPSGSSNVASAVSGLLSTLNPPKPPLAPGGLNRRPMALGLQSPLPLMQLGQPGPATPITQAMGSVSWLRGVARDLSLEPPPSLKRYIEAAGADAGRILEDRVQAAAAAVFMTDAATGGAAAAAAGNAAAAGMPGQRPFPGLQQGVAQERRDEGIKVYWHVLEAMLKAEEARAGMPAACSLLTRWSFHQCLLACSFELVAASYRMGLLSFPAIPMKLGLKPFDLSKMIGPFVKAEPNLPRELKRHLFTVEEKILESLGWAPGSSFYKLMRAATGQQQQQPTAAAAAAEDGSPPGVDLVKQEQVEDAELDKEAAVAAAAAMDAEQQQQEHDDTAATAAVTSRKRSSPDDAVAAVANTPEPMDTTHERTTDAAATAAAKREGGSSSSIDIVPKRQRGQHGGVNSHPHAHENFIAPEPELPLPRALGEPGSAAAAGAAAAAAGGGGGDASAQAVLYDYCRKVLKLASFRLVAVSEHLDFSPMERGAVLNAVYEVLSHALYNQTHLFYSRHLDTLLLASLYGYCKVNRMSQVTFREIIAHYKRQAHAKQEVFRTVVLQQTDPGLVTQNTGDIIAFYNMVFVPAMKGFLLTTVQPQPGAQTSNGKAVDAARTARSTSGELAADVPATNTVAAAALAAQQSSGAMSPIATALLHAQQQQQRGWAGVTGNAYRALSLAGGAPEGAGFTGGGSSSSSGALGSSSTNTANPNIGLNGAGGGGLALGMDPAGFSHSSSISLQGPGLGFSTGVMGVVLPHDASNSYNNAGGSGLWGVHHQRDDTGDIVAAAAAPYGAYGRPAISSKAAAAATMPMPAAGAVPSRLSRLSRPTAASAVQQQHDVVGYSTTAAAAAHDAKPAKVRDALLSQLAAADLRQQQDQDVRHHAAAAAAPASTAVAAADGCMDCDNIHAATAAADCFAYSSSSPAETHTDTAANPTISHGGTAGHAAVTTTTSVSDQTSKHSSSQAEQQQQQHSAGSASPAALTTLMQALDTNGDQAPRPSGAAAAPQQSVHSQVAA